MPSPSRRRLPVPRCPKRAPTCAACASVWASCWLWSPSCCSSPCSSSGWRRTPIGSRGSGRREDERRPGCGPASTLLDSARRVCLTRAVTSSGDASMAVPKLVRDIMTRELTTLAHDVMLLDAVLLMRSSGFRHVPVVNGDKLVGLLSDRDVQRAAPSIFGKITPEEYNRIFETTPIAQRLANEPVTVSPATLRGPA